MRFGWEVNPQAQDEGEWRSFEALSPGLEVKLRSTRSPLYRSALLREQADPKWFRKGKKGQAYREERIHALIAQHLIVDWRVREGEAFGPVRDAAGAEVPMTPALALELMTDRVHQPFADAVVLETSRVGVPDDEDDQDEEDDVPSSSAPQSSSI